MLHHLDWTENDLEALSSDAIPATSYKPRGDRAKYDAAYTHWKTESGDSPIPARDNYRLAWRRMAANTGERTLISAIIPARAAHVDGIFSAGSPESIERLPVVAALAGSLVHDFMTRVAPKGDIRAAQFERLPWIRSLEFVPELALRALRLNCLTDAYADLWSACYSECFCADEWATSSTNAPHVLLGDISPEWTPKIPLRTAEDRRRALVEIDSLVALSIGVTVEELCTIYRTQFPVLYGYDTRSTLYDANGRTVPASVQATWRKRGQNSGKYTTSELSAVHPGSGYSYEYSLPFSTLDRENDLRVAYVEFGRRMAARS